LIKENVVVIFGCNYITDFLIPDYHFWGSVKRWAAYGHLCNKKSTLIFSKYFSKKTIREKWKGNYKTFNNIEALLMFINQLNN
ncbi:hypothetical protein LCGC14_3038240, partial [marine sediment metagenome]